MNARLHAPWFRRWPWLLAALLIVGAVAWRLFAGREAAPEYVTTPVERGSLSARVTATGTLSALVTVQVGSQVSGRIQELFADFNSRVTKGQLIATIDPRLFEADVQQQRANLAAAQAELSRAQVQAKDTQRQAARAAELAERGLLSQGERDTAKANADAAQAGVVSAQAGITQARAALTRAETNLAYTRIVSPTDGVVISRDVDVGQTVAASLQAPILFTIAQDLRQMQVNTSVSESDVGRLRAEMPASFTVDAYPGERFQGQVRQVRDVATTVQNVVTYDAVIDVENPDLKLKPGMTANVTFVYARAEDVLRVPNAALRFRPPQADAPAGASTQRSGAASAGGSQAGGRRGARGGETQSAPRTVWVLRDGAAVAVQVTTGISDGAHTEVTGGELREGDLVISDLLNPTASRSSSGAAAGAPPMRMF
ncbi:MAG TPA: efflux RND transporter periplasmic adaptor subunit [Solimonas sp.]